MQALQLSHQDASILSESRTDSPNFTNSDSQLKKIPINELRIQTRNLLPNKSRPDFLDWLTLEKEDDFEILFYDLYTKICASKSKISDLEYISSNIQPQVKNLKIQYVRERKIISEYLFNWMADEPNHDCCSIVHHLFDIFSENKPVFEDFSIEFLSNEFNYFMQNIEEMDEDNAELGKSAFVIFQVAKKIYKKTEDNEYKDQLYSFLEKVYYEMISDEKIAHFFEITDDIFSFKHFKNLSSKVFALGWSRYY